VLKEYVQMGGNAGVADHVTVGMGAKIAAKTGIMQDVAPGMKMAGLPAYDGRQFMRREAAVRKLPQLMAEFRELKEAVTKLTGKIGLDPVEDEDDEDFPEPEPGQVTRFLRNRPAPAQEQPPAEDQPPGEEPPPAEDKPNP
jgi:hypothetical protein